MPSSSRKVQNGKKDEEAIQILDSEDQESRLSKDGDRGVSEEEEVEMEQVDLDMDMDLDLDEQDHDEDEMEMEQVDLQEDDEQPSLSLYQDIYAQQDQDQDTDLQNEDQDPDGEGQDGDELIYKDGKGQPRNADGSTSRNIEIKISNKGKENEKEKRKLNPNTPTSRDKVNRLAAHKLHVLSLLASAKLRNKWADDETLKDELYTLSPTDFPRRLEKMKKSQTPELRERVRLFESLIQNLTAWWSHNFILDPNATSLGALRQPNTDILSGDLPIEGRRIDGWIVESGSEREARQKRDRKKALREERERKEAEEKFKEKKDLDQKGKGKARAIDVDEEDDIFESNAFASTSTSTFQNANSVNSIATRKRTEITLFGPGTNIRPVYLRLLPNPEIIRGPSDLREAAKAFKGSRETSAQLMVAMCRALNIPARLVISLQVVPWSVGASKVATTSIHTPQERELMKKSGKKRSKLPSKPEKIGIGRRKKVETIQNQKPVDEATSDDEYFTEEETVEKLKSSKGNGKVNGKSKAKEEASKSRQSQAQLSGNEATARRQISEAKKKNGTSSRPVSVDSNSTGDAGEVNGNGTGSTSRDAVVIDSGNESSASNLSKKGKQKAVDTSGAEPQLADGTKWSPSKPKTPWKPKLRTSRPRQLKATELAPDKYSEDVEPIDVTSPPTMWVEVYGRAIKRWYTIDPIRGFVPPLDGSRRMEPTPSDRQNKLVYVVGFEEDGTGRDLTPRYTKTLHTRISRMRPPSSLKGGEDWWSTIVDSMKRKPRPIERDAVEDIELENYSNKEAMPTSVAQFKDHPVFVLERHLKREEVVFPKTLVSRFDGGPVYYRKNVVEVKSVRSWYRIGRIVKDGEEELKRVKARNAYTMRRKREQEAAKLEENHQAEEEFLYAEFQTELFVPPAIGDDGKIPTNSFGNIDLFVPSMLPPHGAHIPYKGSAKIAKKLGIEYAEAVTGFDFKAKVAAPVLSGIVVAAIYEETVKDAYWESEQINAQRETTKKQERALKNWKKLLNAVRIVQRINKQYGPEGSSASGMNASNAPGHSKALPEGVSRLKDMREPETSKAASSSPAGGFVVEDEEDSEMSDGEGVDKEAMADAVRFMKAQQQAEESEARQTSTPINGNSTVRISLTSSTDGKRRSRAQVEQSAEDEDDPEVVDSSPIPTKRPRRQVQSSTPNQSPSTSTRPRRSIKVKIPTTSASSASTRRSERAKGEKSKEQLEREEQERLLNEEDSEDE